MIEECNDNLADEREQFWIKQLNTLDRTKGYNRESGGNVHKTLSQETRQKMSESRRRWFSNLTPEEHYAYCEARKLQVISKEGQQRKSLASSQRWKGIPKTKEHREKIAKAHRGLKHPIGCTCKVHKGHKKLTPDQEREIREKRSAGATIQALAIEYNVGHSTISRTVYFVEPTSNI